MAPRDVKTAARLPWRRLRGQCDPATLPADTTDALTPLDGEIVGQRRALRALELATRVQERDYNVFVSGPARIGKTFLVTAYLRRVARDLPTPGDWVYVHDFQDMDRPRAISLPAGRGRLFRREMEALVRTLQKALQKSFQAEAYQVRRQALQDRLQKERGAMLRELERRVEAQGFVLQVRPEGMVIFPVREGVALTEDEIKALPEEERARLEDVGEPLHGHMNQTMREIQALERSFREQEAALRHQVAEEVLAPPFLDMGSRYEDVPEVRAHLEAVRRDILGRLEELDPWEEPEEPGEEPARVLWERYCVNLLVDHGDGEGAPVVMEPNPTYANLFGKVERRAEMGVLVTDLSLIRAGAVHRANGGFLVLQAADLLEWPLAWEAIKRALRLGEVRIEDTGEQFGMVTTKGLSPEPMPLSCRVILVGSPALHQMLYLEDDQYRKIFKVKADLDDQMDRDAETVRAFCSYLASVCAKWGLRPVERTGMARLVEYGSELAGRQDKLTLQLSEVEDMLREAHIWCCEAGETAIRCAHVEQAIEERTRRVNLPEEKIQEMTAQGVLKIDTRGRTVGVVNGLSVYDLGDHVFARPTRVTASISLGRDGILDIEREAKLGGNVHTKGVLILTGFLRQRYAQDKPLSLSASLCFEQSYEDVEGDSASGAELCALLSSLAFLPARQGLAVTGAVSQHGELLPVGDVTRKIEGFYAVCKLQGLTGRQGVIIPKRNVRDLMLSRELVEAVRRRRFHIYAVENVDEAMVILTETPAGRLLEDGAFEADSINDRVDRTLRHFNDLYREYGPEDEQEA